MKLKQRLFEPGAGWLRWGYDDRYRYSYDPPDYEHWQVAPPLRRLAIYLRWWLGVPHMMVVGMPADEYSPKRYRFSWEEARPCWPSDLVDEERRR